MESPDQESMASPGQETGIVVFMLRREAKCEECHRELFEGNFLRLENKRPLCLDCADLGHLEFLPRGNVAVTRRATKYSPLRAVALQWSRTRKRYERQGILVSPEAILRAEDESLADAEKRERQRMRAALRRDEEDKEYVAAVALKLREFFPGCPVDEADAIAAHACEKYSGRVGRSAAAKDFDHNALRLAVVARIRHCHTRYDELLGQMCDRQLARAEVAGEIDRILRRWQAPSPTVP